MKLLFFVLVFFTICFSQPQILPGWPVSIQVPSNNDLLVGNPIPVQIDGIWHFVIVSEGVWTIIRSDGQMMPGFPRYDSYANGYFRTNPIGDVFGTGRPVILFYHNSPLKWVDLLTGTVLYTSLLNVTNAVLTDLDGDGIMEAVCSVSISNNCILYAVRPDGSYLPGFPSTLSTNQMGLIQGIGDTNGDAIPEIYVKTNFYSFLVSRNGTILNGWPIPVDNGFFNPIFRVTSSLFEIDTIQGVEIIDLYRDVSLPSTQFRLDIKRFDSFSITNWPISVPMNNYDDHPNTPAVACDLNGDGFKEIFIQSNWAIRSYHINSNPITGWPIQTSFSQTIVSPTFGDVDGDSLLEIMFIDNTDGNYNDTSYIRPRKYNGTIPTGFPYLLLNNNLAGNPPTYGDFNCDGFTDLAIIVYPTSSHPDSSSIGIVLITTNTPYCPSPWPMSGHDPMQTNCETTPQPVFTSVPHRTSYSLPNTIYISEPYPNPFNSQTKIYITLPKRQWITAEVFDQLGRRVELVYRGKLEMGEHTIRWYPTRLTSGVYTIAIQSEKEKQAKRVVLLK